MNCSPLANSKNGISLIAVLMFMLAATTASIVIYRIVGSENFSSGSRLKASEAYQASESGIDAVQAWLTYKALDAGALVGQYMANGATKKPVRIDGVLGNIISNRDQNFKVYLTGVDTLTRPYKLKFLSVGEGRDNSKVSQTAIFSVDGLYRLLVQGKKQSSPIKYNEDIWGNVSNVNRLEVMNAVITNNPNVTYSGGQALNYITIGKPSSDGSGDGYLILDGDFFPLNITVYGDLYSTGNLDYCDNNSGVNSISGNLYVGGEFYPHFKLDVGGDAYFKGGVNPNKRLTNTSCTGNSNANGQVRVSGNSTIGNDFFYYKNSGGGQVIFQVNGNLVMDNGIIDLTRYENGGIPSNEKDNLTVNGNVCIQNPLKLENTYVDCVIQPLPFFGNASASNVYIPGSWVSGSYITNSHEQCNPSNGLKSSNPDPNYKDIVIRSENGNISTPGSCSDYLSSWGADPMDGTMTDKNLKGKIENHNQGCQNTPIQFDKKIYDIVTSSPNNPESLPDWVHRMDKPGSCKTYQRQKTIAKIDTTKEFVVTWEGPPQQGYWRDIYDTTFTTYDITMALANPTQMVDFAVELQDCYDKAKEADELRDGWLVVYIKDKLNSNGALNFSNGPSNTRAITSGNYIIIFDFAPGSINGGDLYLPQTKNGAEVMLYLPNGFTARQSARATISLARDNNTTCSNPCDEFNYFIFSDKDITEFRTGTGQGGNGNIMKLHGNIFMNECSTLNTMSGGGTGDLISESNSDMIHDLMDGGILCDYDGSNECGFASGACASTGGCNTLVLVDAIPDKKYISTASRLFVKLESKEITKEKIKENFQDTLGSSILIMPRVIYLAPDQIQSQSELKKYYAPLYLNGANETSTQPEPICGITNFKTKSRYLCTFPGRPDISDFYVIIDPDNDAASPAVTARCNWEGKGKTMYSGQEAPNAPEIVCSSGETANVYWSGLPPSYLVRGTYIPIPSNVTCGEEAPTNAQKIDCGTLQVKKTPDFTCVGAVNDEKELPIKPDQPIITINNDEDHLCTDNNSTTPNANWKNVIWTVNKSGNDISNTNWSNIFNSGEGVYDTYRVSGKCGDYASGEIRCDGSANVTGAAMVLACANVPSTGTPNIQITPPAVTCGGTQIFSGLNWSGAPNWNQPAQGTYNNVTVSASSGDCSGQTATCGGSLTVSTPSSSSTTVTITCTFAKSSYVAGEDVLAPTINCDPNDYNKEGSASFSATGVPLPNNANNNWKNSGGIAIYDNNNTGLSTVSVSNITCRKGNDVVNNLSTTCTPFTISEAPTISCKFDQTTYKIGQNVPAPTISCSSGAPGGTVQFTNTGGSYPNQVDNWKSNSSTYYTQSGSSSFKVSGVKCDNISPIPNEVPCTPLTISYPTAICEVGDSYTYNIGQAIPTPYVSCGEGFSASSMNFGGTKPNQWNSKGNNAYTTDGLKNVTLTGVTCISTYNSSAQASLSNLSISCGSYDIKQVTCSVAGSNGGGTTFDMGSSNPINSPLVSYCDDISSRRYTITPNPSGIYNLSNTWELGNSTYFNSSGSKTITLSSVECNNVSLNNLNASCGTITINASAVSSSSSEASSSSAESSSSEASSSSVAPSSSSEEEGDGGCQYRSGWCDNMYATAGQVPTNSPNGQNTSALCVFVTSISGLYNVNNATTINGVNCGGYMNPFNANNCSGGSVAKKDGGYYLHIPAYGISNLTTTGSTAPNCGGGEPPPPASSSSAAASSSSEGGGGGCTDWAWTNNGSNPPTSGCVHVTSLPNCYGQKPGVACGDGTCSVIVDGDRWDGDSWDDHTWEPSALLNKDVTFIGRFNGIGCR